MKIFFAALLVVTLIVVVSAAYLDQEIIQVEPQEQAEVARVKRQSPNEWKLKCKNGDQSACRHVARNHYQWAKDLYERCQRKDFAACHEYTQFMKP